MKLNLRFAQGFYNTLRYQLRKQKSTLSHSKTHTLTHKRFQNRRCIFSLVTNHMNSKFVLKKNAFLGNMNQIKWKKTKTSSWLQCFTAIDWTTTFRAQKQFQFWNYRFLRATHKLIAGSRNKVKRSNFITGNAKHAKRS